MSKTIFSFFIVVILSQLFSSDAAAPHAENSQGGQTCAGDDSAFSCSTSTTARNPHERIQSRVANLKAQMSRTGSYRERINILKNAFAGEKAYIVACGPSVGFYDAQDLERAMSDGVVISIKQAQRILPNVTDFHLTNVVNLVPFEYSRETILIHQSDGRTDHLGALGHFMHFNSDVLVYFDQKHFSLPQQLAFTHNFDDFLFENSLLRPWGPGIMYEIAFYLAIHLGVREAQILGWDLTDDYKHFWQSKAQDIGEHDKEAFVSFGGEYGASVEDLHSEFRRVRDTTWAASQWLESRGVKMVCLSPISKMDPRIPRVRGPVFSQRVLIWERELFFPRKMKHTC